MIEENEALNIARVYAEQYKLGWSESDAKAMHASFDGKTCIIVNTADFDLNGVSWMEQRTTTPLKIYIDAMTGKCFGYEYGNRGIRRQE